MKELEARKQELYMVLADFTKEHVGLEVFPELSIVKAFPMQKRIQMLNKLNLVTNYYLPDLRLSTFNKLARVILIAITLILIVSSFVHFEFYIALNTPSMLLGVCVGCIVFPFSIVSYFFPYLIYKSSFGNISTVEDFINEMLAINQTRSKG